MRLGASTRAFLGTHIDGAWRRRSHGPTACNTAPGPGPGAAASSIFVVGVEFSCWPAPNASPLRHCSRVFSRWVRSVFVPFDCCTAARRPTRLVCLSCSSSPGPAAHSSISITRSYWDKRAYGGRIRKMCCLAPRVRVRRAHTTIP